MFIKLINLSFVEEKIKVVKIIIIILIIIINYIKAMIIIVMNINFIIKYSIIIIKSNLIDFIKSVASSNLNLVFNFAISFNLKFINFIQVITINN